LSDETGPALPVGLQIMAPTLADEQCFRVASAYEAAYNAANGPILNGIPALGGRK
jgi:aspartyl-tRNA(Asn)/glutamyl-tRNA(Gln) amidotransferase subunit A